MVVPARAMTHGMAMLMKWKVFSSTKNTVQEALT